MVELSTALTQPVHDLSGQLNVSVHRDRIDIKKVETIITAGFTCQPCGKAGCGDGYVSHCITAITAVLNAIDTLLLEKTS